MYHVYPFLKATVAGFRGKVDGNLTATAVFQVVPIIMANRQIYMSE